MRVLALFFFFMLSFNGIGQEVSGMVQDISARPLPGVTITLFKSNDKNIAAFSVTDSAGKYRFLQLDTGRYLVKAFAIGFDTAATEWQYVDNKAKMLSPLILQNRAKNLQEVRVTARKPIIEVQPDKTVFNVEGSINAIGTNALELLQNAPGVLVDKDDNISVNGKNGVQVYIDGKPSPLGAQDLALYLRSLPSADIEAIEIITNPSARYEAAGNAGIVNIRLKKNKNFGTNGSATAGWSVGLFPKYSTSISLNHRNRKMNVFGTYSFNQSRNQSFLNLFRFQGDSVYDQRSVTQFRVAAHNAKAGVDWTMNTRQTLGLLLNVSHSDNASFTQSSTPIRPRFAKEAVRTLQANSEGSRRRTNLTANVNYRFNISKDRSLNADLDYGVYDLLGAALLPNRYFDNAGGILSEVTFSNRTPVGISLYAVKADYEQPWKNGKWSSGFKSSYVSTRNTFEFYNRVNMQPVLDDDRSNAFRYQEQIHAAYMQGQGAKGKWNYQAGVRMEQTISRGLLTSKLATADQDVKRSYLDLFPSGGLTYRHNERHQWGLSFSRRIDRPSYQDLNPFENRLDELTYQKGNPFLRPQYTRNIEWKHTYKYKLNSSLGYSHIRDVFAAITDTIEGQRNFITQRNLAHQKVLNFNMSLPFAIAKWWNVYANAGVSRNRYRAVFEAGKSIDLTTVVANVYQQHSFTLSKKWKGEISGFYLSPYVWGGTYECRSIWSLDAGISATILKGKGSVRLSGSDLFRRMPWSGISRFGSLMIDAGGGWESRLLKLNFTYRFGNNEVKAARQRKTGLEDFNNRVQ